jgi:hypothetical protein
MTADFSTETLEARMAWNEVLQFLKENNCQLRLLNPEKLSCNITGKIETFH